MVSEIKIEEALSLNLPIIDVRSPGEFEKGHIPSAVNIPLFSNDERAHIGTVYKQESKEKAVELGYKYVNPKLDHYIKSSLKIAPDGKVIVHCWRGGMRSLAFARHLSDNGFSDVKQVIGGYKSYRNLVLENLSIPVNLKVLGGYTGSGKTYILDQLKELGHQILDLEGLANHKGSVFGGIGQLEQPSWEQFENNLHKELISLNLNKPIWVEDESHKIGRILIPIQFFEQMRNAKLYFIDIPKEERAKHLVTGYANCDKELLVNSINKIAKRLGGLNVKNSIKLLEENKYYEVAIITLSYYDKYYLKGMNKRESESIITIPLPSTNHYENALKIGNDYKI
ncbi:MAG: tRNA 2-selenouridine(34) synthase MnmH [Melioribacteraceae bacterium]|nr:tRNA 2-selenouridine(34) synthase MnmH [Melioribacteraceae bacterium]